MKFSRLEFGLPELLAGAPAAADIWFLSVDYDLNFPVPVNCSSPFFAFPLFVFLVVTEVVVAEAPLVFLNEEMPVEVTFADINSTLSLIY